MSRGLRDPAGSYRFLRAYLTNGGVCREAVREAWPGLTAQQVKARAGKYSTRLRNPDSWLSRFVRLWEDVARKEGVGGLEGVSEADLEAREQMVLLRESLTERVRSLEGLTEEEIEVEMKRMDLRMKMRREAQAMDPRSVVRDVSRGEVLDTAAAGFDVLIRDERIQARLRQLGMVDGESA